MWRKRFINITLVYKYICNVIYVYYSAHSTISVPNNEAKLALVPESIKIYLPMSYIYIDRQRSSSF